MANSTLTNLFVDIADAIREKNGTGGSIPALEFPDAIRSISGGGGGSDCMPVPDEYQGFVDEAKTLYDGDYSYLAVIESPNILNVAFLMDDFTVLTYNESSTEFTAIGWLYCEYTKATQTWRVVDYTLEASAGMNFVKHIRYSSVYWEYNGQVIWPVGAGGGGAGLNIAYGDTAPDDTTKLWVKAAEPSVVRVTTGMSFDAGSIQTFTNLPYKAYGIAVAKVGDKVYLFGGCTVTSPGYSNNICSFDPNTKAVTVLTAKLPVQGSNFASAVVGTKVYLFCGQGNSNFYQNVYVFDTADETVVDLGAVGPYLYGTKAVAIGTKVYLFGGYRPQSGRVGSIQVFDTTTNGLTTLGTGLPKTGSFMAGELVGTKVYLFGGSTNADIVCFDPETSSVRTLTATLPSGTQRMASALVGSKIYLLGGQTSAGNVKTVNVFDVERETIETIGTELPQTTGNFEAVAVGANVYAFGGCIVPDSQVLNTIYVLQTSASLDSGTMVLQYTTGGNLFPVINSGALTIELCPVSVHIGDASGAAQPVEAFAYKDGAWSAI